MDVKVLRLVHKKIDDLEGMQGEMKCMDDQEYQRLRLSMERNGIIAPLFLKDLDVITHD